MSATIGFISLGCPKNQVDAELMLSRLVGAGYKLSESPIDCDVVIINTCAFIDDAKKESIDNIIEMGEIKKDGDIKKIVVTGCLSQRFGEEVLTEMPEVDGVVGLGANGRIEDVVARVLRGEKVLELPEKTELPLCGERLLTTPEHWAYLKIAEGCSNGCSFCAIPSIRGRYRSRSIGELVDEAAKLAARGVRELVLVAQDTTYYGYDLYGEYSLDKLLAALAGVEGISWLRVLYCYPERITDALIDEIAKNDKVVKYLDIPIQHADADVLRRMGREGDLTQILALVAKLRERIPGIALRTTVMTGFPGETEEAFGKLQELVERARFDKLGVFAYSQEEGTPAGRMDCQIDDETKLRRKELIEEKQAAIQAELQRDRIGGEFVAIVEDYDGFSDSYFGRLYCDAPDIDFSVRFVCPWELSNGEIVRVAVLDVDENGCDLIAEVI
ncbi:MAG: 30S ribosomal protein S12 methylthiotransferase RimO [Clostridia bacterium]|nr:30S ribosomal protein S12 methylthiotransferase RimO [Clostridia bacterium]